MIKSGSKHIYSWSLRLVQKIEESANKSRELDMPSSVGYLIVPFGKQRPLVQIHVLKKNQNLCALLTALLSALIVVCCWVLKGLYCLGISPDSQLLESCGQLTLHNK